MIQAGHLEIMQPITDLSQLDPHGIYTYADYLTWRLKERIELIKGKILKMSPAPSRRHQDISTNLFGCFYSYLQSKPSQCKLYTAPFDVRLYDAKNTANNNAQDIYTVVQPDLCIVCDRNKLDERGCIGAPDLIVEILSPGNSKKELQTKFSLYESSGVKEYWLVFPAEETLQQFVLKEGKFEFKGFYNTDDQANSSTFDGLTVNLTTVFAD